MIVDYRMIHDFIDRLEIVGEGLSITTVDQGRIGKKRGASFEIDEAGGAIEVEIQLLSVQQMKQSDVMLAKAKVLQSLPQRLRFEEEVGYNYDKGSLGNLFSGLVDTTNKAGIPIGFQLSQLIEDDSEMNWSTLGGDLVLEIFGAAVESDGITLLCCEISESARNPAGVVEARISFFTISHRPTGIYDEAKTKIRIRFEFLDVVSIRTPPGSPVETAGVITRHIFTILGELKS